MGGVGNKAAKTEIEKGAGLTSWMQEFACNSEEAIYAGKHHTIHNGFTIECVRRVGWIGSGGSLYVYQGNCPSLDEFCHKTVGCHLFFII